MEQDTLAMLGLIIGAFFCISPLPTLWTAITKDKDSLKSISIPATIMTMSCSTTILAFCQLAGDKQCQISCWMFIASSALCLLTYTALNFMFITSALLLASQIGLAYGVYYLFTPEITSTIMFALNVLGCILMPLEQLDKLLKTRDPSYCSYLMNVLNAISCTIWGLYHQNNNNTQLSISNFAGIIFSVILVPGVLYANEVLDEENILVKFSKVCAYLFYGLPTGMLESSDSRIHSSAKTPKTPQPSKSLTKGVSKQSYAGTPGLTKRSKQSNSGGNAAATYSRRMK